MFKPCRKVVVGFVFVLIMLFSFYAGVVQAADAFGSHNLFGFFNVSSLRQSNSTGSFVSGDTLIFRAECLFGGVYDLKIYQNSSLVFEVGGEVCDSSVEVCVLLYPPVFNAGKAYTAVLYFYVFNHPMFGVYSTDSEVYVFEVAGVETRVKVNGEYDDVFHSLILYANLTDVDGYPIANERISFYLQFEDGKKRLTDGWLPVGSAKTNASGIATLSVALNVPSEGYLVKACHERNENFGFSESYGNIAFSSYLTFECSNQNMQSEAYLENGVLTANGGNLTIHVCSTSPYVLLPTKVIAQYVTDTPLPTSIFNYIAFICDYMNSSEELLGLVIPILVGGGPPYVYEASIVWSPKVIGYQNLFARL